MLPLDDLAEVTSALTRTDLDTLLVVDRRHHSLIQSHFDGKGPLRFVSLASATAEELCISGVDVFEKHPFTDSQQFCRSLRNCYVACLSFDGDLFSPEEVAELQAIRNDYILNQAHISGKDADEAMHLFESVPQCTGLMWTCSLTSDFFSRASIRNVRYLNLYDVESDNLNSVVDWLHSTAEEVGFRRLVLLQDVCDFYAEECVHVLKEEFLGDTQSSEYHLFVYGDLLKLGDVCDETAVQAVGDVLEVEPYRSTLCVARLSKASAERVGQDQRSSTVKDNIYAYRR